MYSLNDDNILKVISEIPDIDIVELLNDRYLVFTVKKHKIIQNIVFEKGENVIITLSIPKNSNGDFEIEISNYNSYADTKALEIAKNGLPCDELMINEEEFKNTFELNRELSDDINKGIKSIIEEDTTYHTEFERLHSKFALADNKAGLLVAVLIASAAIALCTSTSYISGKHTAFILLLLIASVSVAAISIFSVILLGYKTMSEFESDENKLKETYEKNIKFLHETYGKYIPEPYRGSSSNEKENIKIDSGTFGERLNN